MSQSDDEKRSGGIGGLRFNSVTEEPTRAVLTPQARPAARRRAVMTIALAVFAALLLILLTWKPFGVEIRSGGGKDRAFRPDVREPDAGPSTNR